MWQTRLYPCDFKIAWGVPVDFTTIVFALMGNVYCQYIVTAGAVAIITAFLATDTRDLHGSGPSS